MNVQVYDSLTRRKQPLLAPGQDQLRMYVCGPTVYDHIHVGNARTYVSFQLFARYLRHCGLDVQLVCNVTDINDKIYAAARERGIGSAELAEQATAWYREDTDRLGIGRPDLEPLASGSIAGIIALSEELVDKGLAYEAGGDVYYKVRDFPKYGRLSNRTLDDMLEGSRDDLDEGEHKQDPLDFVLWKATKDDEDTSWDSPWGRGRPGWHIECSAMAQEHLGDAFDVHAGGLDLAFPHHENEIAQSKGAGHEFARLWMHGGMLQLPGGDKMSKSTGNIDKLNDALDRHGPTTLLLFYFSGLYRNPIEWSEESLEQARAQGRRITEALRRADRYLASVEARNVGEGGFVDTEREWEGIHEALRDDFNMPAALGELNGLVHDLNSGVDEHATPQIVRNTRAAIIEFCELFGLGELVPGDLDVTAEASALLEQREAAREAKDFDEADRIRDELASMGYVVRDTADGAELVELEEEPSASVDG